MKRIAVLSVVVVVLGAAVFTLLAKRDEPSPEAARPASGLDGETEASIPSGEIMPPIETADGLADVHGRVLADPDSREKALVNARRRRTEEQIHESLEILATQKGWRSELQGLTQKQVDAEVRELESAIHEMVRDEMERRFDDGLYEVVSDSTTYSPGDDFDATEIQWVRIPPGGPVQRVTLPVDVLPEAHEMKARAAWLHLHRNSAN